MVLRQAWGHRERLRALCGVGALLALVGIAATTVGVQSGLTLAATGAALAGWEALGLWLWSIYGPNRHSGAAVSSQAGNPPPS